MATRSKVVIVALSFVLVGCVVHFLSNSNDHVPQLSLEQTDQKPSVGDQTVYWDLSDSSLKTPKKEAVPANDVALFMDEGVRYQFKQVSEQYQRDIQFPSYSKPLSKHDWAQLNPRPFVPHSVPLSGADSLSAEIVLDHFQTTREETLPVLVKVYGESERVTGVQINLSNVNESQGSFVTTALSNVEGETGEQWFQGEVKTAQLDKLSDGDVLIQAQLSFEQAEPAAISATFLLSDSVATLVGLEDSFVDGSDLIIPLEFDVEEDGLYRIRANLFDKSSDEPISHLNASFRLSSLNSSGQFNVHASVLRHSGSAGPYVLKDFSVIKSPETPGQKSAFGHTNAEQYEVSGFDLDSYSREEYQDELTQKRLEFLQKMSSDPL